MAGTPGWAQERRKAASSGHFLGSDEEERREGGKRKGKAGGETVQLAPLTFVKQ
jgi:hypothetical protein